ncbi:hypothetical protein SpCBS45565_g01462 [Spizellomyces sp. 'palustris']|nr:hypothetical protein SpCBS45565_g01462 [Spizellomyces sp. 'palustris']
MALASLDTTLSGARHSAHPSPPPADDVKVVTPVSPVEEKSALVMLDQRIADSLPQSRSPSSLPLSPPSDHHPASPAPSDETNVVPESAASPTIQSPIPKSEECVVPSSVSPASSPAEYARSAVAILAPSDIKLCRQLLNSLKKHHAAWPFLAPVDPLAVGAPDYFNVIKKPMDLSTVERKLASQEYAKAQELADDVQLMLNNCFTYNPPTNAVHQLGKTLETHFSLQVNKLFPALTVPRDQTAAPASPHEISGSRRQSKRQIKPPRVFEPESIPAKKVRTSISGRRNSTGGPAAGHDDDMEVDSSDDDGVSQQISTLASCLETIHQQLALLTEKKKPKRKRSSGAGLAETTVKRRRSSKAKVSRSSTGSPAPELADDEVPPAVAAAAGPEKQCEYCGTSETPMWRRGPSGCGTLCNKCGVKWRNGKIMGDNKVPDVPIYSANTPFRPKPKARKLDANGKPKPRSRGKKGGKSISYEQKKELSELIGTLTEDAMTSVFEIIRAGLPHLRDTQEEIEIDIDTIDDITLTALYEFVKSASKAPKAAPMPVGPRGLTNLSPSDDEVSDSDGSSSSDSD